MNTLCDDARNMLESVGYATYAMEPGAPWVYFEDECLLGFVRVYETPEEIATGWRAEQDVFLRQNASRMLRAPVKAWNAYGVFLTRAAASQEIARTLFAIEEDFQGIRKIARGGIRTREELAIVLGPLLPVQTRVSLLHTDVHSRLLDRLGPEGSARRLLLSNARSEDIAKLLVEEA